MGGHRAGLGHDLLGITGIRPALGVVVGLHHLGLGWVLVLGPGGKRGLHALVGPHGIYSFHHGAKTQRHVPDVEHRPDQRGLWVGAVRDVHEPGRLGAVGPLLWGFPVGLDIPAFPGGRSGGPLRHLHLALPTAEERPEPGFHALPGGGVPSQQPAVSGHCLRHPLGHRLSPVIPVDQRRGDHDCPSVLRPGERAFDAGLGLPDGRWAADTVAESRHQESA